MPFPESLALGGARLRRWHAQRDLEVLGAMLSDDGIARFVALAEDEAGLFATSQRFADHWDEFGFGLWAVRSGEGPGAGWVGACHPLWHPEFASQVELAWSLTASLRGRGLATAAARAAADACFAVLGLDEVIAFVNPRNDPSLAVTERLGMRSAGSTIHPDGTPLAVFSLAR